MTRGGAAGYLRPHAGVPAGIVAAPQLQVPGGDQWVQHVVLIVHIEGVGEVLQLAGGVGVRDTHTHKIRPTTATHTSQKQNVFRLQTWLTC